MIFYKNNIEKYKIRISCYNSQIQAKEIIIVETKNV